MPEVNKTTAKQDMDLGTVAHQLQEAANACKF